jgi:putative FmdB family regulatory protein
MPIYEYQCTSCHHQFDLIQKVSDEPITECPSCHKDTATKLVSAAGFQLKGTGWYVTDFKNKQNPSTQKKTETAKSTSTENAGATSDSTSSKGEA